jgi:hypothetical protein
MNKQNQLEQQILIGRSRFAKLVTEFNRENIVSRLVIKDDEGEVIKWTRCNSENDYKDAILRLSKKLQRRISYVYIIPVLGDGNNGSSDHLKRSRVEFS